MSVAAQSIRDELEWNETQKGYVLSSFYWGYALGQIPASYLMITGVFSPRWTFGLAILIPSILTLFVPYCARQSYGAALFIRMLIGLIESATFPACFSFFMKWVPRKDKTFMIATMLSGTYCGEIVGFSLAGGLINCSIPIGNDDYGGWPSVFYVFGLFGIVWFPIWVRYAYESPEEHPAITIDELEYIREGTYDDNKNSNKTHRPTNRQLQQSVDIDPQVIGEDLEAAFTRAFSKSIDPRDAHNNNNNNNNNSKYNFDSDSNDTTPGQSMRGLQSVDLDTDYGGSTLTTKLLNDKDKHQLQIQRAPLQVGSPLRLGTGTVIYDSEKLSLLHHDENAAERSELDTDSYYGESENDDDDDDDAVDFSRIPWGNILRHPGFWNLMWAGWCVGYIQFLLLSEVPSYLTDILGFDLSTAGILSTIPFAFMMILSISLGQFLYRMQKYNNWSTLKVRLFAQSIALGGPSLALLLCSYTTDDKWGSYIFIVIATMCVGGSQSGLSCAYLEFAPRFSPFINTLANAAGAAAGIVGPVLVSALITKNPNDPKDGWNTSFVISGIMCTSSVFIWYFFAANEVVDSCNTLLPKQPKQPKQQQQK